KQLEDSIAQVEALSPDKALAAKEPDTLDEIKKLRPNGPRQLWKSLDAALYKDKLAGAFLSRMAGCTLGAPVEFDSVEHMENWAKYTGDAFPPTQYWSKTARPGDLRYHKADFIEYTRDNLNKVPVDDDITYTILGLLIAEDYGVDFNTENVGEAWKKYLPYACTAEEVALENLKNGVAAKDVADINNPYCQWIGADIRSDPFAYIAAGNPEKAAELAYYDAYLSHRRNGIYGEMFFAAAQAAAFAVDTAREALEIGLTEIPAECTLAKDIRWAIDVSGDIKNYKQAREAVNKKFDGMSLVHTNNNACLTVFGLLMGGNDVTKVISETVAMGMDNDCTAATAGSIVGAIVGKNNMPKHWYKDFNNVVDTYLIDVSELKIDDIFARFEKLTRKIYSV
ncbi:MAG: ADP-ribosylglycohydrolase family protein, partial [Oscillospiraceae bacterium]